MAGPSASAVSASRASGCISLKARRTCFDHELLTPCELKPTSGSPFGLLVAGLMITTPSRTLGRAGGLHHALLPRTCTPISCNCSPKTARCKIRANCRAPAVGTARCARVLSRLTHRFRQRGQLRLKIEFDRPWIPDRRLLSFWLTTPASALRRLDWRVRHGRCSGAGVRAGRTVAGSRTSCAAAMAIGQRCK
jgi:hypothetical protein